MDFLGFSMDFLGFSRDFLGFSMDFLGFSMDFLGERKLCCHVGCLGSQEHVIC